MLNPIGIGGDSAADWLLPSPPVQTQAMDAAQIQRALGQASCNDRPQTALALMQGFDDAALTALASSEEGRSALRALDDALADAPVVLIDVQPQRERIADALPGADGITRTTVQIGDNTVTWTNDSQGRPLRAEADLSEVFSGIERSYEETRAQGESADRGIEGDHGGHLIGHRFVQDQGLKNLFPQEANFNLSAYKKLENEWADWIDSGKEVSITVDLAPREQDRPERVRVAYEVTDPSDGRVVYDQRVTFRNEPGQQFDRVPRADMGNV